MGSKPTKSPKEHNPKGPEEIEMKDMHGRSANVTVRTEGDDMVLSEAKVAENNFETILNFLQKYYNAKGAPMSDREIDVLKDMRPLKAEETKAFMQRFHGSDGLAYQHLVAQGNTISLWEKEATRCYLRSRETLNKILVSNTSLQAISDQEDTRVSFYQRYSLYNRNVHPDQGKFMVNVTFAEANEPVQSTPAQTVVQKKYEPVPLTSALSIIQEKKQSQEKIVELESLFFKAIRELKKINKGNISLVMNWRPETTESNL